jgi:hypothetical protein
MCAACKRRRSGLDGPREGTGWLTWVLEALHWSRSWWVGAGPLRLKGENLGIGCWGCSFDVKVLVQHTSQTPVILLRQNDALSCGTV